MAAADMINHKRDNTPIPTISLRAEDIIAMFHQINDRSSRDMVKVEFQILKKFDKLNPPVGNELVEITRFTVATITKVYTAFMRGGIVDNNTRNRFKNAITAAGTSLNIPALNAMVADEQLEWDKKLIDQTTANLGQMINN